MDSSGRGGLFRERKRTTLNIPSRLGASASVSKCYSTKPRPLTRLAPVQVRPKTSLNYGRLRQTSSHYADVGNISRDYREIRPVSSNYKEQNPSSLLSSTMKSSLYPGSTRHISSVNKRTKEVTLPGALPSFLQSSTSLFRTGQSVRERLLNKSERPKTVLSLPKHNEYRPYNDIDRSNTNEINIGHRNTNGNHSNTNDIKIGHRITADNGPSYEPRQSSLASRYLGPSVRSSAYSDLFSHRTQQPKSPSKDDNHRYRFSNMRKLNGQTDVVAGEEFMPSDSENNKTYTNQGPGLLSTVVSKLASFFSQPVVSPPTNSVEQPVLPGAMGNKSEKQGEMKKKVEEKLVNENVEETVNKKEIVNKNTKEKNDYDSEEERRQRTKKLNVLMKEEKKKAKKIKKLSKKKSKKQKIPQEEQKNTNGNSSKDDTRKNDKTNDGKTIYNSLFLKEKVKENNEDSDQAKKERKRKRNNTLFNPFPRKRVRPNDEPDNVFLEKPSRKFFLGNEVDTSEKASKSTSDAILRSKLEELEKKDLEISKLNQKVASLENSLLDIHKSLSQIKADQNSYDRTSYSNNKELSIELDNNQAKNSKDPFTIKNHIVSSTPAATPILQDWGNESFGSHIPNGKKLSVREKLNNEKVNETNETSRSRTPQVIIDDFKKISEQIQQREQSLSKVEDVNQSDEEVSNKDIQEVKVDGQMSDDEFDDTNIDETLAHIEKSLTGLSPVRISFQE